MTSIESHQLTLFGDAGTDIQTFTSSKAPTSVACGWRETYVVLDEALIVIGNKHWYPSDSNAPSHMEEKPISICLDDIDDMIDPLADTSQASDLTPNPRLVCLPTAVKLVSCGWGHVIVVLSEATTESMMGWGSNDRGQLGLGKRKEDGGQLDCGWYPITDPQLVHWPAVRLCRSHNSLSSCPTEEITQLALGRYHTLVLTSEGLVYACGDNTATGLGIANRPGEEAQVSCSFKLTQITRWQNEDSASNITSDTNPLSDMEPHDAWEVSALSLPPSDRSKSRSHGVPNVVKIAAGAMHSAAIDKEGSAYTWGLSIYGALGYQLEPTNTNHLEQGSNETKCEIGEASSVLSSTPFSLSKGMIGLHPGIVVSLAHVIVTNVACGMRHTLFLSGGPKPRGLSNNHSPLLDVEEVPNGGVYGCGGNERGQLGVARLTIGSRSLTPGSKDTSSASPTHSTLPPQRSTVTTPQLILPLHTFFPFSNSQPRSQTPLPPLPSLASVSSLSENRQAPHQEEDDPSVIVTDLVSGASHSLAVVCIPSHLDLTSELSHSVTSSPTSNTTAIVAWGWNSFGQCALTPTSHRDFNYRIISSKESVISISAGYSHSATVTMAKDMT